MSKVSDVDIKAVGWWMSPEFWHKPAAFLLISALIVSAQWFGVQLHCFDPRWCFWVSLSSFFFFENHMQLFLSPRKAKPYHTEAEAKALHTNSAWVDLAERAWFHSQLFCLQLVISRLLSALSRSNKGVQVQLSEDRLRAAPPAEPFSWQRAGVALMQDCSTQSGKACNFIQVTSKYGKRKHKTEHICVSRLYSLSQDAAIFLIQRAAFPMLLFWTTKSYIFISVC